MERRKKSTRHLFFGGIIALMPLLMFVSATLPDGNAGDQQRMKVDSVVVEAMNVPVLENNSQNPVKHIVIYTSGSEKPLSLTRVLGEEVGDIQRVNVHYGRNENDFGKSMMLYLDHDHSPDGKLGLRQPLSPGENHFWISLNMGNSAHLMTETGFKIKDIVVSRAHYKQSDKAVARRGIALRRHGEDSVDTYRIPGLVTTNKGSLIAVYDIRRNGAVDLQEDVDIGMSRSTDGGETWEPMKVIMDMGEWGDLPENQNGIGDPSVLVDKNTGTIWVAAVWAHGHQGERNWWASKPGLSPSTTSQFMLTKSEDDGLTWSEPINITSQIKDPKWHLLLQGPGKGITMSNGTLVFPAQYKDEKEMPHSTIIYSSDGGKSWQIGTGAKANTTEAQVVELNDGSLMLNMRDNRGGSRSVYTTTDMGKNWTMHSTSRKALPEPVCMASLVKHSHKGKELLLFSNPNATTGRFNMTIKLSKDYGNSWPEAHQLLLDAGRGRGYSCMTSIDEETIGILYESSRADLVFQKIMISELLK